MSGGDNTLLGHIEDVEEKTLNGVHKDYHTQHLAWHQTTD